MRGKGLRIASVVVTIVSLAVNVIAGMINDERMNEQIDKSVAEALAKQQMKES